MTRLAKAARIYSLENLEPRRLLSAVSWDGGGDNSHWADPLNWSADQVPTVNDDVTINVSADHDAIIVSGAQATATLTLSGSLEIDSTALFNISRDSTLNGNVALDGGTLTGAKLTMNTGTFRWTGGKLLGDIMTIKSTGKMEWAGGTLELDRFIQDAGETSWTSGNLLLNNITFENTGTMTVDSDDNLSCQLLTGAKSGGFLNHNVLTKDGDGTLTIGAANAAYYDNSETLVEAGTVNVGRIAASSPGAWTLKGSSTVLFPSNIDAGNAATTMIGPDASFPALERMDHLDGSLQLLDGAVLNSNGYLTIGGSLIVDPDSSVHVANDFYDADWQTTTLRASTARTTPYITAAGNVRVGGNNWVTFVDGYDPDVDTTIPLISGATRSGSTPQFAGSGTPTGRPMGTIFSGGLMSGVVLPRMPLVDLLPESDTGPSDSDNITSDDTPTVRITDLDGGHLVLKNGTTVLASVDVTTNEVLDLTLPHMNDGVRTITPTLTSPGAHNSVTDANKLLKITIDTVAPSFNSAAYKPDQTPEPAVTFNCSTDIDVFSTVMSLKNLDSNTSYMYQLGVGLGPTGFNLWTLLPQVTGGVLPDGNYRLAAKSADVVDDAGNEMAVDFNFDFVVLSADGDGSHQVDIADFNLLAADFGKTGQKFSQGNYDRSSDGKVTITDFNILASNFGKSITPPTTTTSQASFAIAAPAQPLVSPLQMDADDKLIEVLA